MLERHSAPYPLPRAVHADDEVVRILQAVGAADGFLRVSRPMPGMRLVDAEHRVMAEFDRGSTQGRNGFPEASMFDQPDLEAVLLDLAERDERIDLRRGCEVTSVVAPGPGRVTVTVAAEDAIEHLVADAVLGCDGANSMVREHIGASMRDLHFEERWFVVDVRTARDLHMWPGVHQICDPARPATAMNVTGRRYRWEFRMAPGETAADLAEPARLAELLSPWIDATDFDDCEIIRHAEYTFRARVADRWRRGRVLIAGDAAHQTPPFIGQGLGAGLRDAQNLAWKLADVLTGVSDDSVLDTYEAERIPHVTAVVRMAVTVGWVLTGGQDGAARVRRAAIGAVCRIPGVSRAVLSVASPPLAATQLVDRRGLLHRVNGTLCPQGPSGDGRRFDDTVGGGHLLLTRGPLPAGCDVPAGADHLDVSQGCAPEIDAWLRKHRVAAVLVRPDHIVRASCRRLSDVPAMLSRCDDIGSRPAVPTQAAS
ncbi:bifunctional 3-(3-hydroxy-phenyl)propionate/3-hydroxycinnamic acid hydroxylase [Williamsia deligens]